MTTNKQYFSEKMESLQKDYRNSTDKEEKTTLRAMMLQLYEIASDFDVILDIDFRY